MKEKANQIYTQMVAYFTELKEEYRGRFVQTLWGKLIYDIYSLYFLILSLVLF